MNTFAPVSENRACPHCGVRGRAKLMRGKSTRPGVFKCYACRRPFSITVKTPFHRCRIPHADLARAIELVKGGCNARKLALAIGVAHTSAWRLRTKILKSLQQQ